MIRNEAQYSVYLNSLIENDYSKEHLNKALSTYPLYQGKKEYDLIPTRESLNEKILNEYRFYEIGFETVGRFLYELEHTMNIIMPYYNEMFKTIEIMADLENPFDNVDVTETYDEQRTDSTTTEGTSTSTGTATSEQSTSDNRTNDKTVTDQTTSTEKNKLSDTPQNNVTTIDNYLTEYREGQKTANSHGSEIDVNSGSSTGSTIDESETTQTANGASNATGTTKHTFTKKGNQGVNTYAHDMNEFRTSIIDIVDKIVHDKRLKDLFMLVW